MRLFVAVELPRPVREHLDSRACPLRDSVPGWRWSPAAQWHLTLAFLGQVEQERLAELSRRMLMAAHRHQPFDLRVEGFGAFGSARQARVLWAGVGGDREALVRLADSVSAGARRSKIAVEERRYRPHLTLARRRTSADLREVLAAQPAYEGPAWRVEDFVLVESHLGSTVRHEIRERYPLGRAASLR